MKTGVLKTVLIFTILCVAGTCGYQSGSDIPKDEQKNHYLGPVLFLPDNNRIMFSFSLVAGGERKHAVYDLSSGRLSVGSIFPAQPPSSCSFPQAFSRDGKKVVCSYQGNLYIADADGGNLRQLTFTREIPEDPPDALYGKALGQYASPSFSPDGKHIIFRRPTTWIYESYKHKQMGSKKVTGWDVYEIDVETGVEKRLTYFKFYEMSAPFYLPDGKRFIFSGMGLGFKPEGHTNYLGRSLEREIKQQNSIIYIMDGKKNVLCPAFESPGRYAKDPVVAMDGTIVYKAIINELDNLNKNRRFTDRYDLFVRYDLFIKKGKIIKRLTHLRTDIYSYDISNDGSRIVFMEDQSGRYNWNIWAVNSDGAHLTKIEIPWKQITGEKTFTWGREQKKMFFSYLTGALIIGFLIMIILFRRKWDFLWPRLITSDLAKGTAHYGLFVAFFGVYEIFADAYVRGGQYFAANSLKLLFEIAVYVIIGLGIWRLFRVASLAILGIHIYGIFATFITFIIYHKRFPPLISVLLALFLILLSLNCMRGTFAWHMFRKRVPDDTGHAGKNG